MEEAKAKKEIIVKRLSAFKFEVAVSDEHRNAPRVSVIQRAPPALPPSQQRVLEPLKAGAAPGSVLIRHAILHRIVELLLWKLLGEQRLRRYCDYPNSSTCVLLGRVVSLSSASSTMPPETDNHNCNGSYECFLDHVMRFLEICAPTEELWGRFGWSRLKEEAILRKIYDEDLSPSFRIEELQKDSNILHVYTDMQLLLQWEQQGYTAISWQGERYISTLLPDAANPENRQLSYHKIRAPHSTQSLNTAISELQQLWSPGLSARKWINSGALISRRFNPYGRMLRERHRDVPCIPNSDFYHDHELAASYNDSQARENY